MAIESAKGLGILLEEHCVIDSRKLLRCGPGKSEHQDYHKDYPKVRVRESPIPLKSLIVAIQDNTRLRVRGKKDIVLDRGDFILFGSRFEHAGAGYSKLHFRLFCYIGPQGFNVGNVTDYGTGWEVSDGSSEGTV